MEPRDAWVQVRVTEGELSAWKLAALQSGRSVSEFVRLVVRQAINGKPKTGRFLTAEIRRSSDGEVVLAIDLDIMRPPNVKLALPPGEYYSVAADKGGKEHMVRFKVPEGAGQNALMLTGLEEGSYALAIRSTTVMVGSGGAATET